MFGTSMSESSKRREYSRSWMSWKSARSLSTQASSIDPEPTSTRSSYPWPRYRASTMRWMTTRSASIPSSASWAAACASSSSKRDCSAAASSFESRW